ncbi:hypothetical protein GC163_07405 [bacterium]|nr:hypothetical protein [bacterium]
MLKPMILPIQITTLVVFLLAVGLYGFLRYRTKYQKSAAMLSVFFAIIAFIPALIATGFAVDAVRYGIFTYQTATQVQDPYVLLPASAKDITLHKYASGHEVMFSVSQAELVAWMVKVTQKLRGYNQNATSFVRDDTLSDPQIAGQFWSLDFGKLNWEYPPDVICYKGWHSQRGTGFDIWYSPSTQRAFIRASYW